ncbi:MAG: hypothetical protein V4620_00550 [Bacteroidota bacterium]
MFDLLQLFGKYDLAWSTSHGLALFIMMFIMGLLYGVKEYLNMPIMATIGISVFFLIHILNYFLFLKNDKYKEVIEYYKKEPKNRKVIGRLSTVTVMSVIIYSLF